MTFPPNSSSEAVAPSKDSAMEIIQQLDQALYEMNMQTGEDYKAMEEAQQNAFLAAQLIHSFSQSSQSSSQQQQPGAPTRLVEKPLVPRSPLPSQKTVSMSAASPMTTLRQTFLPQKKNSTTLETPPLKRKEPSSSMQTLDGRPPLRTVHHESAPAIEIPALQWTLQLERTQAALEQELMAHQQTQVAHQQSEHKRAQLQRQYEELQATGADAQAEYGRRCEAYEAELQRREQRLLWAEQEAASATDILFKADEERQRFEALYLQAQEALQQQQQQQLVHLSSKEKESEKQMPPAAAAKSPNRSLVAMGRQLLLQQSQQSARHERVRSSALAETNAPPPVFVNDDGVRIRQLLEQSGERLQLWASNAASEGTLEQLTQQYTTRVEVRRVIVTCV